MSEPFKVNRLSDLPPGVYEPAWVDFGDFGDSWGMDAGFDGFDDEPCWDLLGVGHDDDPGVSEEQP